MATDRRKWIYFTAYCLEVIELPYGQFEFKLMCYSTKDNT